jgi:hypothetical protein
MRFHCCTDTDNESLETIAETIAETVAIILKMKIITRLYAMKITMKACLYWKVGELATIPNELYEVGLDGKYNPTHYSARKLLKFCD